MAKKTKTRRLADPGLKHRNLAWSLANVWSELRVPPGTPEYYRRLDDVIEGIDNAPDAEGVINALMHEVWDYIDPNIDYSDIAEEIAMRLIVNFNLRF